jgi:hypothetical protein
MRDFEAVKAGSLGGFVESETDLSHKSNAWVFGDAEAAHVSIGYQARPSAPWPIAACSERQHRELGHNLTRIARPYRAPKGG